MSVTARLIPNYKSDNLSIGPNIKCYINSQAALLVTQENYSRYIYPFKVQSYREMAVQCLLFR